MRTANDANAGAGGLSAIDSVLGEVSRSSTQRHVSNLFRVMDMQPDHVMDTRVERAEGLARVVASDPYPEGQEPLGLNRGGHDPYSVVNDPKYYDQDTRHDSAASPEAAMGRGSSKGNAGFDSGGLGRPRWTHNNLDAAAYHLEAVGTPINQLNNWHDDPHGKSKVITKVTQVDTGSLDNEHIDYDVETPEGTLRAFPTVRNPKQFADLG